MIRMMALGASCLLAVGGSWALSRGQWLGAVPLGAGMLLALAVQSGIPGSDAEVFGERLARWLTRGLVAVSLVIAGISCFSYLGSWTGFHFDTAEHWANVTGAIATRHYYGFRSIYRAFPFSPHLYLAGLIVEGFGPGLAPYRFLGALECFLLVPVLFLLVRRLLTPMAGAFAALFLAGSLWNFTMSKLAHFAVPVPLTAAVTVLLFTAVLRWRRFYVAAGLLACAFSVGLNIYEAYRVLFPAVALMTAAGFLLEGSRRWRLLLVPLAMAAAVVLQFTYLDPHFFSRLRQSALLSQQVEQNIPVWAEAFAAKLFVGRWDIELSPSQGGVDHPVLVGLFLVGLMIAVRNVRQRWGYVLAAWVAVPCALVIAMEGPWRRATVILAAFYGLAAVPAAFLVRDMAVLLAGRRAKWRAAAVAAAAVLCAVGTAANVGRAFRIHAERSGGYYILPDQIKAAKWAAQRCPGGDFLLIDIGRWQVWNLVQLIEEGGPPCFVPGVNCYHSLAEPNEARRAIAAAANRRDQPTLVLVSSILDTADARGYLDALVAESPPLARRIETAGTSALYLAYSVGGPSAGRGPHARDEP